MIDIQSLKNHVFDVLGAMRKVHEELGPGLNEYCYQEGLMLQLKKDNIDFIKEMSFHPTYMGVTMNAEFRIDFLCKNDIIVECKAVQKLVSDHRAQLFNYMRLLKQPCGILVNFYPAVYRIERYFYDKDLKSIIDVNGHRIFEYN